MRRCLIFAVIATAAFIWSQSSVLAQTATGLSSLSPATVIHDTDTLPLCQNGAPSCSLLSYLWASANIGQIVAHPVQPVSKTGPYTLTAADSGKCFDNGGATVEVDFTMPAYVAGLNYCFVVMSAHVLKVVAPSGVQIAMAPNITAVAGNVQDTTLYDTLTLIAPAGGSTVWVARAFTGTGWSLN